MTVAYVPRPRYVVERANTITSFTGQRCQGAWEFVFAFNDMQDAIAAADREAEDNEWVRVIDRTADDEENN